MSEFAVKLEMSGDHEEYNMLLAVFKGVKAIQECEKKIKDAYVELEKRKKELEEVKRRIGAMGYEVCITLMTVD